MAWPWRPPPERRCWRWACRACWNYRISPWCFLRLFYWWAVRSSLGPALACAGLSFLAYNFLFIPPTWSLTIERQEDVLTLLFFLLMAGLTGNLASRQRRQLEALRQAQAETTALLDLSRKLTAATDRRAVLAAAEQQFCAWSELEVALLSRDDDGVWKVEAGVQRLLADQERAAADWAWQHEQPAGLGTDTLPNGRWWWLPLAGEEGPLLLLGVQPRDGQPLPGERRRLIAASVSRWPRRWSAHSWPRSWRPRACMVRPRSCAVRCWRRYPMICVHR